MPITRSVGRERKAKAIQELTDEISKCSLGIVVDYRGLSSQDMTNLRRRLREAGLRYKVVKNTLASFAAQRTNRRHLESLFVGPAAIVFGYGEITEPAKVLRRYIDESRINLAIKGGFTPQELLTPDDITTLTRIPERKVLVAQTIGSLKLPIVLLVSTLSSPIVSFMGVIQSRIKQLEGEAK